MYTATIGYTYTHTSPVGCQELQQVLADQLQVTRQVTVGSLKDTQTVTNCIQLLSLAIPNSVKEWCCHPEVKPDVRARMPMWKWSGTKGWSLAAGHFQCMKSLCIPRKDTYTYRNTWQFMTSDGFITKVLGT